MSIPLPNIYRILNENCDTNHTKRSKNIKLDDLYLNADERYEVYLIKAAERPHLLDYDPSLQSSSLHSLNNEEDEKKSSTDDFSQICSKVDPPLIDGCDIPGWRKDNLVSKNKVIGRSDVVTINNEVQSLLNIGSSSTMFRLESQWFNIENSIQSTKKKWNEMKLILDNEPNKDVRAIIVEHDECCQLIKVDTNETERITTMFAIEFEEKNIPAKIMNACDGWKCMPNSLSPEKSWSFENLLKRFGDVYWRFSDTHGEMMSMKTYAKYITNIEGILDDSPLGIYDSEFGDEDSPTYEMAQEYSVPKCFSPDLFELASSDDDNEGSNERPPWRWVLIGPERSGTGLHVDPLWTNAWVTVIQGKKRWCLFPPQTPKEMIGMGNGPQINSASWFHSYYEKVCSPDWPEEYKPIEVLQLPGETVFVPNGWPHLVLNLEMTVAVTHNYASEFGPFERMWEEVNNDEPVFAKQWLNGMEKHRIDLYDRVKNKTTQNSTCT